MVNTTHLERAGFDEATRTLLKRLLSADSSYWNTSDRDGGFWFAPEDTANVLVQLAAKVFAVTAAVPRRRLAEGLANALRGRSRLRPRPDAAAVESWLIGSRFFEHDDDSVTFLGPAAHLTPLERECGIRNASATGSEVTSATHSETTSAG